MSRELRSARLGQLVDIHKGVSYKGEFLDTPGPSLLGLGVVAPGGGFREGNAREYGGPYKPHHEVRHGDLFIALTDITQDGSVLGSPVIVPASACPAVITHHVAALRLKSPKLVDSRYLYYFLRSDASRSHFRGMATGTTVRAVSPTDAALVEIPLPSLSKQKRIARILGALDDKIDLYAKINRTLENLIQAMFEGWFVRFDGPDTPELATTRVGPIPTGWTVGGIDALVDFNPCASLKRGTNATYIEMKALPTSGPSVSELATRPYAGGARFQQNDTLMARITPCLENGKSALVDFLPKGDVAFGSTEFIVFRPKPGVPRAWPYCLVRHEPFRAHAIANMTGSSGRQRVTVIALLKYPVALPPPEVLQRFGASSDSLLMQITRNTQEVKVLRALRDTLIRKLITSSAQVSEAPSLFEGAV